MATGEIKECKGLVFAAIYCRQVSIIINDSKRSMGHFDGFGGPWICGVSSLLVQALQNVPVEPED